jgi:hypothetical protein
MDQQARTDARPKTWTDLEFTFRPVPLQEGEEGVGEMHDYEDETVEKIVADPLGEYFLSVVVLIILLINMLTSILYFNTYL